MRVYLVMDVENMTQHEEIEVWATKSSAAERVLELNAGEPFGHWLYDEREVEG